MSRSALREKSHKEYISIDIYSYFKVRAGNPKATKYTMTKLSTPSD